ncbi:MAG: hypothetical protein R2710_12200 [Acidimicrobiales bacterium]
MHLGLEVLHELARCPEQVEGSGEGAQIDVVGELAPRVRAVASKVSAVALVAVVGSGHDLEVSGRRR